MSKKYVLVNSDNEYFKNINSAWGKIWNTNDILKAYRYNSRNDATNDIRIFKKDLGYMYNIKEVEVE